MTTMIKKRRKDDLDKTFERLMRKPEFKKEWEAHEAKYEFGRELIRARLEKNLSQQQLAEKAGTTQAVISRIESDSVSPSLKLLSKIASGLGKKLELKFV